MKKRIMGIFSAFFLFILLISFFITGCATTHSFLVTRCPITVVTKFDASQFDSITDEIMELNRLECNNLKNKKIFTSFSVSQKEKDFLEDYDFSKGEVKKIEYDGNIGEDIKRKLDKVLTNCCGSEIVNDKAQADITINADVEKYYSQVLDLKKKGDDSFVGLSGEKRMNFRAKLSTVLSIINSFENDSDDWKYNHLLSLTKNRVEKVNRSGVLYVNFRMDFLDSYGFIVDYDDEYTIATGTLVSSIAQGSVGVFNTRPRCEYSGNIDIYDVDTMEVKKRVTLDEWDVDARTRQIEKKKEQYFDIYSLTPGNLKYLIYDYIKQLIGKLNRLEQK